MTRIHDYCTSLAISAMLTSAFLATAPEGFMAAGAGPMGASAALESAMAGLRADGWHGATGMALPTTIAVAQTTPAKAQPASTASPFTEIQLKKINLYWDTKNDFEVRLEFSKLLGLTRTDEPARMKKISGRDDQGIRHLFGRLENGAGYFLSRETSSGEAHGYWVGLDFKVIAAVSKAEDQSISILPAATAQKELESEYKEWRDFADKL